jgi:hypothetical protein
MIMKRAMVRNSLVIRSLVLSVATAFLNLPLTAQPVDSDLPPPHIRAAAGLWDIAVENSNKRCNITFSMASEVKEQPLRFPLLCRRTLPILSDVIGWRLGAGMILQLTNKMGKTVLEFDGSETDTSLKAVTTNGEVYYLEPKQKSLNAARRPTSTPLMITTATPEPPSSPPPLSKPTTFQAEKPQTRLKSIPGIYALDRRNDKSLCLIELMSPPPEPGKRGTARLLDTCRDEPMKVFSPIFWSFEDSKLSLIAKRGNTMTLLQDGNLWRRSDGEATDFVLRRLE